MNHWEGLDDLLRMEWKDSHDGSRFFLDNWGMAVFPLAPTSQIERFHQGLNRSQCAPFHNRSRRCSKIRQTMKLTDRSAPNLWLAPPSLWIESFSHSTKPSNRELAADQHIDRNACSSAQRNGHHLTHDGIRRIPSDSLGSMLEEQYLEGEDMVGELGSRK